MIYTDMLWRDEMTALILHELAEGPLSRDELSNRLSWPPIATQFADVLDEMMATGLIRSVGELMEAAS